jgi:hypothetical protein
MPRVKTIEISRLFNLGRYEHVKIGFTLELVDSDNAGELLDQALTHIEKLDPTLGPNEVAVKAARQFLAKPVNALNEHDLSNVPRHQAVLADAERAEKEKATAKAWLSAPGYLTETHGKAPSFDSSDSDEDYSDEDYP